MKKIFMSLMAICVMALAAGFCACEHEKTETQIFDLGFNSDAVEPGEAMVYQNVYEPIIIEALKSIAIQPSEEGKTFMINNSTEKKAKAAAKAAFDSATAAAQKAAGTPSAIKGLKVTLKYSNTSNPNPVDYLEYTFK